MTEWAEEVFENSALVTRGLREIAWDAASIEAFLERYLELKNSTLSRDTVISRIRHLLGMRRKVEESVTEDWINVPLYRFGAPSVNGATVEYSEEGSMLDGGGWNLKVFGIGTGNTTSLQVNKARTFVANAGTCKLVFIPIKLRVAQIAIYDRDRLVGRGHEAQVAPLQASGDQHLRRRGCKTLPTNACGRGPTQYTDVVECWLSGDSSGVVHRDKRSWETDVAQEVSVHLMKFADVSALVRVRRTRRLELSFLLPAGYDYRAYLCPGVTWWESPHV